MPDAELPGEMNDAWIVRVWHGVWLPVTSGDLFSHVLFEQPNPFRVLTLA